MNLIRISFFSLFLFVLTGCGGGSNDTSSGGTQGTTDQTTVDSSAVQLEQLIVVIGDSISTGFNASFAYPDLLQSLTGIEVLNLAKDGSPAEFGTSRVPEFIARFRPMYLVMLLGTINAAGGGGGGVSSAVQSLQNAANIANNAGVIPVIGTIPPISRSTDENAKASAISAGIRGIDNARIARINGAISISDITDGLHPNDRGQEIIARLFAEQIF